MEKVKKGFTLIELLAVMAIMGIVGIIISTVFSSTINLNNKQSDKLEVQQSVTTVQRSMYNDIRKANIINLAVVDLNNGGFEFEGTNMEQNNKYCRLKCYKPLIYIETITGIKAYYVYNEKNGEVRKITILSDESVGAKCVIENKDDLIGKYIIKHGSEDGIKVAQDAANNKKYNIKLHLKKKNAIKEFEFKVSTVDYGGDIK